MRRLLAALAVLAMVAAVAPLEAQDTMALRFYVVPKTGDGQTPATGFRPKYIADLGVSYSAMDYGLEDTFLVGVNVTGAQHTTLAANLDVIAIPLALDDQIGLTALSTVKNRLESLNVPSDWVQQTHTYRDVIRIVGKLFQFMQRFHARQVRRFFESGITLDTRVNQLTAPQRNALTDAASSLNLDTSVVTNTMPLRQALRLLIQQLPSFQLAGETF